MFVYKSLWGVEAHSSRIRGQAHRPNEVIAYLIVILIIEPLEPINKARVLWSELSPALWLVL